MKKYKNFLESLSPELSEEERKKRLEKMEREELGQTFSGNQSNMQGILNNDDISEDEEEE